MFDDDLLDDPDIVRASVLNILRVLAGRPRRLDVLTDDDVERLRWQMADMTARKEDAQIVRCDRCGGFSWQYPVCRGCRTSHQRHLRRTA